MAKPTPKWQPSLQDMAKQQNHLYYVDLNDITVVLDGCLKIVQKCPMNMSDFHTDVTQANVRSIRDLDIKVVSTRG